MVQDGQNEERSGHADVLMLGPIVPLRSPSSWLLVVGYPGEASCSSPVCFSRGGMCPSSMSHQDEDDEAFLGLSTPYE